MHFPLVGHLKRLRRRFRDAAALKTWTDKDDERKHHYSEFIQSGDVVFDVGGNVGNRAKVFAKLAKHVVVFEPQPYCQSILEGGFGGMSTVSIVPKALGPEAGTARLMVSESHTVSSMSRPWIDAVRQSGRFSHIDWNTEIDVPVSTLDMAIAEFGVPSFIKIDVEGFEAEVLAGLSQPVAALSLEFTPEHMESMRQCIKKLTSLGVYEFNLSLGESMDLDASGWRSPEDILATLAKFDQTIFGDVYARRVSG